MEKPIHKQEIDFSENYNTGIFSIDSIYIADYQYYKITFYVPKEHSPAFIAFRNILMYARLDDSAFRQETSRSMSELCRWGG